MYLVRRHLGEIMLAGKERIKMSYGRFIIIMVIVITATVLMMFFLFFARSTRRSGFDTWANAQEWLEASQGTL